MIGYIIKRLIAVIPTFLGMTVVAFVIMNMAPGGPVEQMIQKIRFGAAQSGGTAGSVGGGDTLASTAASSGVNEEILEAFQKQYGFDKPIILNFRVADRRTEGIDRVAALVFSADRSERSKVYRDLRVMGSAVVPYVAPALLAGENSEQGLLDLITENGLKKIQKRQQYLTVIPPGERDTSLGDEKLGALARSIEESIAAAAKGEEIRANLLASRRSLDEMAGREYSAGDTWRTPLTAPILDFMGELAGPEAVTDRGAFQAWWSERRSAYSTESIKAQVDRLAQGDLQAGQDLQELGRVILPPLMTALIKSDGPEFAHLQPVLQHVVGKTFTTDDVSDPAVQTTVRETLRRWWKQEWLTYSQVSPAARVKLCFVHTRYATWLKNIVTFDFGNSFTYERPVIEVIKSKMPVSIWFGLTSFVLSYIVCIPLGLAKAVRDGTPFDYTSSVILFFMYSIPGFVLGIMLIVLFGGGSYWDLIPIGGFTSDSYSHLTLLGKLADKAKHMAAPLIAYMVGSFTTMTLLMKNSIIEEIAKDYCRTARAKGLGATRVYLKHALRNALIPLVVGIGGFLVIFFAGSFLIEKVFNLDGMGLLGYTSVLSRDFNVLLGEMVIFALIGLLGRLLSDFIYTVVDPRIDFAP